MTDHPESEVLAPDTSPARLAEILRSRPDLGAAIAVHPHAYEGLLDWLSANGDEKARAAVAARRGVAVPLLASPNAPSAPSGAVPRNAAPAAVVGTAAVTPGGAARKPRKRLVTALAIGGAVVLVGGGGAIWAVTSASGGASTPEAAVATLVEGLSGDNPLSLVSAFAPSEISGLQGVISAASDVKSAEGDADYRALLEELGETLTIDASGLDYETEELMEGVSRVSLTEGTLVIDAEPDRLADAIVAFAADSMRGQQDALGYSDEDFEELLEYQRGRLEEDFSYNLPIEVDFAEAYDAWEGEEMYGYAYPYSAIMVEENGGWYTSPLLTLSAYQFSYSADRYGDELIDAERFDTPEDAVEGTAEAVERFARTGNYEDLAATMPLAERRWLSLFGPVVADGAGGGDLTIDPLDVTVVTNGNEADIELDDVTLTFFDSYGDSTQTSFSGVCWSYVGYYDSMQQGCLDDWSGAKPLGLDEAKLVAVRENGGWLVSPLATVYRVLERAVPGYAELVEDGDLDELWEQ